MTSDTLIAPNGVIIKNVADLRREASEDSERVTQAIMGQPVLIQKDEGGWLYVQTWDTYHGWTRSRLVSRTVPRPARTATVSALFTDALRTPDPTGEIVTKLVITSVLEFIDERNGFAHVRLPNGEEAFVPSSDAEIGSAGEEFLPLPPTGLELVHTARRFLGIPYLWGGTSPFGLDCSGFMQLVHKINRIALLRDSHMQADDPRATRVDLNELAAGDLVFFAGGDDKTRPNHVGMACGDGAFIHSARGEGVTINNVSDEQYSSSLLCARRMP